MSAKTKVTNVNSIHIGSEYTEEDKEFLAAVKEWMKVNRRKFPSFIEILNILKDLGYRKVKEG